MSLSCALGLIFYMFFYWFVPSLYDLKPFVLLLNVVERTVADPDGGRWPLWQRAIELTASHPWLGVGPLHFAHHSQDLKNAAHPHNIFLQVAAEWGLPALTIFLMLIISGICALTSVSRTISDIDFRNQTLHTAFTATAISIFIDCSVSGLMVMPTSQLWIAIYVGCVWGWIASQNKSIKLFKDISHSNFRFVFIGIILVLIFCEIKGLFPELMDLQGHENESKAVIFYDEYRLFTPRIWRAGYF